MLTVASRGHANVRARSRTFADTRTNCSPRAISPPRHVAVHGVRFFAWRSALEAPPAVDYRGSRSCSLGSSASHLRRNRSPRTKTPTPRPVGFSRRPQSSLPGVGLRTPGGLSGFCIHAGGGGRTRPPWLRSVRCRRWNGLNVFEGCGGVLFGGSSGDFSDMGMNHFDTERLAAWQSGLFAERNPGSGMSGAARNALRARSSAMRPEPRRRKRRDFGI